MKIVSPLTIRYNQAALATTPVVITPSNPTGPIPNPEEDPDYQPNPGPSPTPTPTPTPLPDTSNDTFSAVLSQGPADGTTISGVVRITITGGKINNAELLPEFGYTPIYATFTLAADRRSATLDFNTATLTDRTQKFRISAYNVPPNTSGAQEIVVATRTWTINNDDISAPGTNPSTVIVDAFGDSTMLGVLGTGGISTNPIPKIVESAFPGIVVRNEGVSSSNLTKTLDGTDGVHTQNFQTLMANSNANYVFCMLNEWVDSATYKIKLRQFINIAKSAPKPKTVFLITQIPTNIDNSGPSDDAIDARAQDMRDIGNELIVPVLDINSYVYNYMQANGMTRAQFMPDGLHPTQSGYDVVGAYIKTQFGMYTGLSAGSPAPAPTPAPSGVTMSGPNATLFTSAPTFFDDFDGTTLSNKWSQGLWYDQGVPANTLRINGGCLEMTGQSSSMFTGADNTGYCVVTTDPSIAVGSQGFQQRFGVFEVEAKLPAGKGYWPSFWLFGHPNNDRPEVDVFEAYPGAGAGSGWDNGGTPPAPIRADCTLHALKDPGGYQAPIQNNSMTNGEGSPNLSLAFHKYTVEWDTDYIKFYFNGKLKAHITETANMNYFKQFYLYFLLGLGINYSTAGGPSTNPSITPYGFGSDPNNPPVNVFRVKYAAAWQFKKYIT